MMGKLYSQRQALDVRVNAEAKAKELPMIAAWPALLAFTSVMALPTEDRVIAPDLDRWVIG